jgi:adenylate cyclase class 2
MFEVENKFRVSEFATHRQRLAEVGGKFVRRESQADWYFSHPSRDFRATGEALRLRNVDGAAKLTFKGPRWSDTVKVREELELLLAELPAAAECGVEFLRRLGFEPVACVTKRREVFHLARENHLIEVALDEVDRLGSFVEIELLVDASDVETARRLANQLQADLGLVQPLENSYLKMLLAADPKPSSPSD